MLSVAIMTLALSGGGNPALYPGRPCTLLYILPHPIVGCAGPYCGACCGTGASTFDYRRDFNYPWSQAPCSLVPPGAGLPMPSGPEELPGEEARRKTKIVAAAHRAPTRSSASAASHVAPIRGR